ncbi:hypothetical protein NI454_08220 [Brevundimonas diminuta]|uniref:hypothetical protein n=1 Tax=Brevundimonas diminuta TaxID=293 RepID=UPI002097B13F|nr:hypothetical protein [Brevundimonas diminuta]MCO8029939.1 hypothetical protein [Brevundimonas diminuta]
MIIPDEDGYATFALFRCQNCERDVHDVIFVPKSSSAARDAHGLSTQGQAEIMCGWCTTDYRLDVRNATGRVFAQIVGFPKIPVTCTGAVHRDELDDLRLPWEVKDTPAESLVDALKDIEEVIRSQDAIFYSKPLSRMALIQQFAALEAYLADTITNQVLENPEALRRALVGVDALKDIKLPLAEVAANPDIVKVTVARTLRSMLYHNFAMVDAIAKIALECSIFPSPEVKQRMFQCAPIRHDCVHRNGRDRDGKEHTHLDFDFVLRVGEDLHAMMIHIEDTLTGFLSGEDDPDLHA